MYGKTASGTVFAKALKTKAQLSNHKERSHYDFTDSTLTEPYI